MGLEGLTRKRYVADSRVYFFSGMKTSILSRIPLFVVLNRWPLKVSTSCSSAVRRTNFRMWLPKLVCEWEGKRSRGSYDE